MSICLSRAGNAGSIWTLQGYFEFCTLFVEEGNLGEMRNPLHLVRLRGTTARTSRDALRHVHVTETSHY